jgi:thiol-disulfide isomerase/thioredoxin
MPAGLPPLLARGLAGLPPARNAVAASLAAVCVASAALAAMGIAAAPAAFARAPAAPPSANAAWLQAATDADIDRAFAGARQAGKPVMLYWGASWCPPCNHLKANFFAREDFAAIARSFVVVHIDGDAAGAQKLSRRFAASGYPTVIVFAPDGTERTRLPGDVEPAQLLEVLQLGLAGGRPMKAVLADARAGRPLDAAEWRLLALHAWEASETPLVPTAELPAVLAQLAARAAAAPDPEIATRLWLQALAANEGGKAFEADAALRQRVRALLADPVRSRAQIGLLVGAADIVRTLAPAAGAERDELVAAFDTVLRRAGADTTLSRADRLSALIARIDLARLPEAKGEVNPKLPAALLAEVREAAARADRETTDAHERQAVIPAAGWMLGLAGLWAESDAFLKAGLARSHSAYYLMSQLGNNARKQGRTDEALDWYRQSFEKSQGPATRLQWGSGYLAALVDLAPAGTARIEATAGQLLAEAAKDGGAFEGRSRRSIERASRKLLAWQEAEPAARLPVVQRLRQRLAPVCRAADAPDRPACEALLRPAPAAAAAPAAARAPA